MRYKGEVCNEGKLTIDTLRAALDRLEVMVDYDTSAEVSTYAASPRDGEPYWTVEAVKEYL